MMTENTEQLEKAKPFFDRAEQVEATDNFDYAIDMYVEGLKRAPDALHDGHIPLRRMSFIRQAKGGKKPSMVDKMKKRGGKTPLDQMLNAEYLLAKDPDNLEYIQAMLKAAVQGKYNATAEWIADILFDAAKAAKKPNPTTFLTLKEAYSQLELFDKAVQACSYAVKLKPGDGALADELKNLSANMAMKRGRYEEEGDFRRMMLNRKDQEKLQLQGAAVKSQDFKASRVQEARQDFNKDPDKPDNIRKLANALAELEIEKSTEEAIKLLLDGYQRLKDFSLKRMAGELKIRQYKRLARKIRALIEENPKEDKYRAQFKKISQDLHKTELEHYKACVENYPTDNKLKYEYGTKLLTAKQIDQAIPLFQAAMQDPGRKISAMDKLGICFFNKGWYTDAIDIFTQAIKSYEMEDDSIGKDLRYNLARAYERENQLDQALDIYRKLAQIDFGYKDVRARVDNLRKKVNNKS